MRSGADASGAAASREPHPRPPPSAASSPSFRAARRQRPECVGRPGRHPHRRGLRGDVPKRDGSGRRQDPPHLPRAAHQGTGLRLALADRTPTAGRGEAQRLAQRARVVRPQGPEHHGSARVDEVHRVGFRVEGAVQLAVDVVDRDRPRDRVAARVRLGVRRLRGDVRRLRVAVPGVRLPHVEGEEPHAVAELAVHLSQRRTGAGRHRSSDRSEVDEQRALAQHLPARGPPAVRGR
jgi:hypothetical protein